MTNSIEAIMTEISTCAIYEMKATSAPTCICPAPMRWAAIQTTAMLVICITSPAAGMFSDISRPTRSETAVRSSLAPAKRRRS